MILIGSQTPHRSSPAIGRLFRPLLVAFALALFVNAFSDAHAAPSFEQQYEKAKQDMEFLKSDSKRGGWREPWEKLAQSFFDLHEKYPRWRNRPAALFRSALAMEELAKRSMLRQDAQAAVDRYGVFLKSYASHVLADDALFGIARIKAERFNDFSGAQEALNTIQNQYPRGDVAPEAKLYAQRKDLDIELDDLNTTEIQTNNAIEAAKKRHVDGSDYREVQDLENELATLAKRLDKIEHTRKDVVVAHKEALDRETRAQAIIAKFEEGVKADTKAARTKAADLQAQIDAATKERTALAATLPADVLTDYERLLKQFRGLAVETIQGNIPTVCHTALQASSMSDLNH
ncbi:MAG: hypothetical protein KH283_08890, partial [Collinsella sp.]|nr:hypothetical protein [Collinsella sp.]